MEGTLALLDEGGLSSCALYLFRSWVRRIRGNTARLNMQRLGDQLVGGSSIDSWVWINRLTHFRGPKSARSARSALGL